MASFVLEPSWWSEPDAAEERRALIEAFWVGDLEACTADLVTRCEELERRRAADELVAVGEVAEVLLGQWSVSFQSMLAEAHREFFAGDYDRLARAAKEGRAAALAVRDRFLTPERIDARSLQQALELANAAAADLAPDRVGIAVVRDGDEDPVASGPVSEWEQAWALADELHAVTAQLHPEVFDDAGWELRRRLAEQAAAANSLGHRLASQAVDRVSDYLNACRPDRPGELYRRLSARADAATAAARARCARSADLDL
jgi:hypothetical protein